MPTASRNTNHMQSSLGFQGGRCWFGCGSISGNMFVALSPRTPACKHANYRLCWYPTHNPPLLTPPPPPKKPYWANCGQQANFDFGGRERSCPARATPGDHGAERKARSFFFFFPFFFFFFPFFFFFCPFFFFELRLRVQGSRPLASEVFLCLGPRTQNCVFNTRKEGERPVRATRSFALLGGMKRTRNAANSRPPHLFGSSPILVSKTLSLSTSLSVSTPPRPPPPVSAAAAASRPS